MSELADRVARALCLAQFGEERIHGEARCCQVGGIDGCCLEALKPQARAAIAAMREPSEAMVNAAHDAGHYGDMPGIWHAMIDTALTEENS